MAALMISPVRGSTTVGPMDDPGSVRCTHWITLYLASIGSMSSRKSRTRNAFVKPAASNTWFHHITPSRNAVRYGSGIPLSR